MEKWVLLKLSRNGGRRDKGEWWRGWIQIWYIWYILRAFVNATMYPQHSNKRKKGKNKLQNSSKSLLKREERVSTSITHTHTHTHIHTYTHTHTQSGEILPVCTEALISLFKDQFISCKAEKVWAVLREGLGWLTSSLTQPFHITWLMLCMYLCELAGL
jgi:hypothetical protein